MSKARPICSNKLQISIRGLIALTGICALVLFLYVRAQPKNPTIRTFGDPIDWPDIVNAAIEQLSEFDSTTTIQEFGSKLHARGLVEESNYQHFKDFEFYWTIDQNRATPHYIIAGAFFPTETRLSRSEFALKYVTINVVNESSGAWDTIWSIEHFSVPIHPSWKNVSKIRNRGSNANSN